MSPETAPTSAVTDWLQRRPTPLCWLVGPSGSGKTAIVRAVLASADRARILSLSAFSPDRCLQQAFQDQTTAGLFARLTADARRPLVLDALDTVQHRDEERLGQVFDLRLRHLLSAAARGRWPELSTFVTSRLPPPRDLRAGAVTVIELAAAQQLADEERSLESDPVLEVLASSRKASSGWLLGLLTGQLEIPPSLATPAPVRKVLEDAMSAGLVHLVESGKSGEWFQMPDGVRHGFLSPARTVKVHASIADGLESDELLRYVELAEDDPELLHELVERAMVHRLEAGDVQNAVLCYWDRLGNFSQLERENAIHLGARACCTLNDGRPPHQISPALKESAGALAVINDWGVHAICGGDAGLASESALAACGMITEDLKPWDKSMLARHAAESLLLRARLPEAMTWAERAEQHALDGLRMNEGVPTEEVMSAYDHALFAMMEIAAATHDAEGAARVLNDMVEVHSRGRKILEEVNRSLIVPLSGPAHEVNAEELLDGRPAALAAVVAGRPGDALRILGPRLARWSQERSRRSLAIRALLLRAQLADGDRQGACESIVQLRHLADELDDTAARCELASIAADLALVEGNAEAALALADDFLDPASSCDLRLLRNDLLKVRSRALLALDRVEEAKASAAEIRKVAAAPVVRPSQERRQPAKIAEEPKEGEPARRIQLHEAALAVIEDYNTRGLPFALYLRTFDFLVTHGPMEFGPRLIENVLQEALPPGARVLTIQAHDDPMGYEGLGSRFDRSAPALLLEDENWQNVAASLIPFADLIVSECLGLGAGVRFELDVAYRTNRWDRTVLLLPPLRSFLPMIDSDPLIQMFPRCIWADSLHTESLTDSPVLQDLIARMAAIAALPEADRRRLTDRAARDEAYPIDLLPIAEHYEFSAMWSSQREEEDDRIRYYGFWELFRAASIRGVSMLRGDDSFDNRVKLSGAYVQMSAILLDHERDGDKFVLIGDLTAAEQLAGSARALIRENDGPFASYFRERAEDQLQSVLTLRSAVEAHPDRFVMRPRYGPFPFRAVPSS